MLGKLGIVIVLYVFVLLIRRIVTGLGYSWITKKYFYLEIAGSSEHYWKKVQCKRLAYLLNPFAKTMTLVVLPLNGMTSEKIRIKIYRDPDLVDGNYRIKSIQGGNENEIFMSYKPPKLEKHLGKVRYMINYPFGEKRILETFKWYYNNQSSACNKTYKETKLNNHFDVPFNSRCPIIFKGTCNLGILRVYDYKYWTNRQLREMLH